MTTWDTKFFLSFFSTMALLNSRPINEDIKHKFLKPRIQHQIQHVMSFLFFILSREKKEKNLEHHKPFFMLEEKPNSRSQQTRLP